MAVSIRERGGKRQPRYYYLKDSGAEKLVHHMSDKRQKPKADCRSEIQKRIDELVLSSRAINKAVKDIMDKYK